MLCIARLVGGLALTLPHAALSASYSNRSTRRDSVRGIDLNVRSMAERVGRRRRPPPIPLPRSSTPTSRRRRGSGQRRGGRRPPDQPGPGTRRMPSWPSFIASSSRVARAPHQLSAASGRITRPGTGTPPPPHTHTRALTQHARCPVTSL